MVIIVPKLVTSLTEYNSKASIFEERALSDSVEWYSRFCREAQAMEPGCDVNGVPKYIKSQHSEVIGDMVFGRSWRLR